MCVREFSYQVPYGVIEKKGNFIGKITEKPTQKFLVSAGIYVCEPQILAHIPKNKYLDMPNLTQMLLEKGFKVYSYLITAISTTAFVSLCLCKAEATERTPMTTPFSSTTGKS